MEITSVAIPPMTPPKRAAFFARLASESVFCGVSVGGEEAVLGKLEGVVVGTVEELLPVELLVVGFGAPLAMSTPGPISGLPKNVGVKRPQKSENNIPTTDGLRVVGVPIIFELSYAVHKSRERNRPQRTVTSRRAHRGTRIPEGTGLGKLLGDSSINGNLLNSLPQRETHIEGGRIVSQFDAH
jgi:hypothetical protein